MNNQLTNEQRAHDLTLIILQQGESVESLLKSIGKLDECLLSIDEKTEHFDLVKAYKFVYANVLDRLES